MKNNPINIRFKKELCKIDGHYKIQLSKDECIALLIIIGKLNSQ